jgi:hypothetical protein
MIATRRAFLFTTAGLLFVRPARSEGMPIVSAVIDDLTQAPPKASIGTRWQMITDTVMGGVSKGEMVREIVAGRPAIRLRGEVSLENNGGFVQIALDLSAEGGPVDASTWSGLELDVFGNSEEYAAHLRTSDLTRPWQSYRQSFKSFPRWQTVKLPFKHFSPNRTEIPLNVGRLRRFGLVAIGRAFSADISISGLRFFR